MAPSILILVSEESYFIDRELRAIKDKVLTSGLSDFNYNLLSAKTNSTDQILDCLSQLPMMADKRLVIVRDAENISKDDHDKWISYFQKPFDTALLVMVANKIDGRLKLWKDAQGKGYVQTLKVPYANQLPSWIQTEAKTLNVGITLEAAEALAESIGSSLASLVNALEKLKLYVHPKTQIGVNDVDALSSDFYSKTVFDFVERVGERNFAEASRLLGQMEMQGEAYVKLIFMITRHFRILLMAREGIDQKLSPESITAQMGVSPFFAKDYLRQAQKMTLNHLRKIYEVLLTTDRSLKGSSLPNRQVMNQFLMKSCL